MPNNRNSRLYPHVRDAIARGDLKIVVILGLQRSGTSLLTAMLGRHPEVAMLYEAYTHDFFKLYGKPVIANKLLVPHQIHLRRKASLPWRLFGFTLGRIPALDRWIRRTYRIPLVHYSLEDLHELGARFVVLHRQDEAVADSMMRRAGYSRNQAQKEIRVGKEVLTGLKEWPVHAMDFESLLADPAGQARALCDWLGIPFDEVMLEGAEFNTRYPDGGNLKQDGGHG